MSWAVKLHGQILRVPIWSTIVSSLTALWLLHFLDARKGEDKEARERQDTLLSETELVVCHEV